jgi:hypothetical protein
MTPSAATIAFLVLTAAALSGGDVVRVSDGLALELTAAGFTLTPGDSIELVTTVKNIGDHQLTCDVGWQDRRSFHSSIQHRVRFVSEPVSTQLEGVPLLGLCSTGWVPKFLSVPRGEHASYTSFVTCDTRYGPKMYLRIGHIGFAVEPPCSVAVRSFLKNGTEVYSEYANGGRIFVGEVESNEIYIHISTPKKQSRR